MPKKPSRNHSDLPGLGELPPRYHFFLNPYDDYRFTMCPQCHAKMHQRKLPLVIHVEPMHLIALNKTCRYCPTCDLLIAHQDDLESILAAMFLERAPEDLGNDYLVIGTMERADWRDGMNTTVYAEQTFAAMHDFKGYVNVTISPRGWFSTKPRAPRRTTTAGADANS